MAHTSVLLGTLQILRQQRLVPPLPCQGFCSLELKLISKIFLGILPQLLITQHKRRVNCQGVYLVVCDVALAIPSVMALGILIDSHIESVVFATSRRSSCATSHQRKLQSSCRVEFAHLWSLFCLASEAFASICPCDLFIAANFSLKLLP